MEHEPATDWGKDKAIDYKMRMGLWMFAAYCVLYASFVVINLVWPSLMGALIGGQNLAIWYGFGLIVVAIIIAVIYTALCTRAERRNNIEQL